MLPRTIVYIDGFNLYYGAVRGSAFKWLNLQRLFQLLRPDDNILKIHYFTALVDGPTRPNQKVYLRALGTLPAGLLTWTLTASNFNVSRSHSNANKKVIGT